MLTVYNRFARGSLLAGALTAGLLLSACEDDGAKKQSAQTAANYTASGLPDISFGNLGHASFDVPPNFGTDIAEAMVIQPDGKIVVGGRSFGVSTSDDAMVARFNADGTPDLSFGVGGAFVLDVNGNLGNDAVHALALQADGKIIAAGESYDGVSNSDMMILRLNSDGTLDFSFNGGGLVTRDGDGGTSGYEAIWGVALDSTQRIVAVGQTFNVSNGAEATVWRFQPNGSLDTNNIAFSGVAPSAGVAHSGLVGGDIAFCLTIDSQGRVVVGGYLNGGTQVAGVWRFAPVSPDDLTFDTTFDAEGLQDLVNALPGGTPADVIYSVLVEPGPNGHVIAAGSARDGSGNEAGLIWRLDTFGQPDFTFGNTTGRTTLGGTGTRRAWAVARDGQGRYYLAGEGPGTGISDMYLWRLRSDGTLDPSFAAGAGYLTRNSATGGTFGNIGKAMLIDAIGRVVVSGYSDNAPEDVSVWRFQ